MDTERWEQRNRERMERQRLRMERRQTRSSCGGSNAAGGLIIGLVVIAVGVLFLLKNVGILYFDDIWQYWPVVLIVIGISKIANTDSASQVTSGLILGGIGTVFLLRNLGYIYGNIWQYLWPGVLIAVGLSILVKHLEGRDQSWNPETPPAGSSGSPGAAPFSPGSGFSATSSRSNVLHIENVFSGTRRKIESEDFEGGRIAVVFGGAEIDLRSAVTRREEITIKAEAVFGGIELWVPANWQTIVRGSAVFGSFEDKTFPATPGQGKMPRLVVIGSAVFGSVIVKN